MCTGRIFLLAFLLTSLAPAADAQLEEEITLFDSRGRPVAYIAVDEDFTIYLWDGEPVAYLHDTPPHISVYSFDGKHLGWFEDGIVWDHDGLVVGFRKGAVAMFTQFEPFKAFKRFKPFKGLRELAPLRPILKKEWSEQPLAIFLALPGAEKGAIVKDYDGDKVVVLRKNGQVWLLEAKTWCSWTWKLEGQVVWIKFGVTSTTLIDADEGDTCELWTGSLIDTVR